MPDLRFNGRGGGGGGGRGGNAGLVRCFDLADFKEEKAGNSSGSGGTIELMLSFVFSSSGGMFSVPLLFLRGVPPFFGVLLPLIFFRIELIAVNHLQIKVCIVKCPSD
jgi:hypothetical protein